MTTLIWEGDLFHDVHLITPAKFWKRKNIPHDVLIDFWRIVIEPDEEIKKKTQRKDAMARCGRLKVIDGDKVRIIEVGFQIGGSPRYYEEPYKKEIDSLDFSILHGWFYGLWQFKMEINGEFERKKLTYDAPTSRVLYDGKEFELLPYCIELEKGGIYYKGFSLILKRDKNYRFGYRRFWVNQKNKKGEVKALKVTKYNAFLDEDDNELLPNYGYNKTIQPDSKKYQILFRKDTVERYFHDRIIYDHKKRKNIRIVVNDPTTKYFEGWIERV